MRCFKTFYSSTRSSHLLGAHFSPCCQPGEALSCLIGAAFRGRILTHSKATFLVPWAQTNAEHLLSFLPLPAPAHPLQAS